MNGKKVLVENNVIITDHEPWNNIYKGGIGQFCFEFMKKHGTQIAEIDALTGQEGTYELLLKKCIRISILLQNKGVQIGDVIVIYGKRQLYASVPIISCFFIGAVPTFLDTELSLPEAVNLLAQADPKLIITNVELVETVQELMENEGVQYSREIVAFDNEQNQLEDSEPEFKPIFINNLKETAVIHFSTGSTGLPKGICLSHYALLRRSTIYYEDVWVKDNTKVSFSYNSFYWTVETMHLLYSIRDGICRLIDPEPFEAVRTWHLLEKYKINIADLIPHDVIEMCEAEKPPNLDLTNLTTVIITGSKLNKKYHKYFQQLLPAVDVFLAYGQTEAGPLTTFNKCDFQRKLNRENPGSVGVPCHGFGTLYKVVDIDTGASLGPNKSGELHVKSDILMSGYYNLDSSDHFDEDGWYKTHDVVFYDENLCFFIVDRIKDMIQFQGWHIPPAILEEKLLTHPAVKRAVVVGFPHKMDGEHPMALVVLKENCSNITPSDIEIYITERVLDRFRLRAGVKFVDESYIPATKKLKRYFLKKLVAIGKMSTNINI